MTDFLGRPIGFCLKTVIQFSSVRFESGNLINLPSTAKHPFTVIPDSTYTRSGFIQCKQESMIAPVVLRLRQFLCRHLTYVARLFARKLREFTHLRFPSNALLIQVRMLRKLQKGPRFWTSRDRRSIQGPFSR